jgi:hypothetical protein
MRDGPPGIHVQTMENRRTLARLLSHMLPFLPVPHGKASRCCRARRGSCRQTRKEVRNPRRQHKSLFAQPQAFLLRGEASSSTPVRNVCASPQRRSGGSRKRRFRRRTRMLYRFSYPFECRVQSELVVSRRGQRLRGKHLRITGLL